jgi:hypothetical protein
MPPAAAPPSAPPIYLSTYSNRFYASPKFISPISPPPSPNLLKSIPAISFKSSYTELNPAGLAVAVLVG